MIPVKSVPAIALMDRAMFKDPDTALRKKDTIHPQIYKKRRQNEPNKAEIYSNYISNIVLQPYWVISLFIMIESKKSSIEFENVSVWWVCCMVDRRGGPETAKDRRGGTPM